MNSAPAILTDAVRKTLHGSATFQAGRPVLVACSGGADSVALAAAVQAAGIQAGLAHVNYRLRGADSDLDQKLVENLGKRWGMPVHCLEVQEEAWTDEASLQMKARTTRYDFFQALLRKHGYQVCLIAHHDRDQAETVLLSLAKGNSSTLFTEIPSERDRYLRPFLHLDPALLREALEEWDIPWREDLSNQKNIYQRNLIRNDILPRLAEINSNIIPQLTRRSGWYARQVGLLEKLLEPLIATSLNDRHGVQTFSLDAVPGELAPFIEVIFAHILDKHWGIHGHLLWETTELLNSTTGKFTSWQDSLIIRGRHCIQKMSAVFQETTLKISSGQSLPVQAQVLGRTVSLSVEKAPVAFPHDGLTHFLSLDQLNYPLTLCPASTGDSMQPLGMTGTQLLSDIMINRKYRPAQKHKAVVLKDATGIVCLSDFRVADRVKLGGSEDHVLKLVIEEAD